MSDSALNKRIEPPDRSANEALLDLALHKAMLDATPDCVKIIDPQGALMSMSRSGCHALGVCESSVAGTQWIPLLPESIHEAALQALAAARSGKTARFSGHSEASGNIVFWDNLLTPVLDESGRVQSIVCVSRDVTEKTLLEKKLEEAFAREQLLCFEMQHRIKNVFTVVNAVVMMADKEARLSGDPSSLRPILTGKLDALARASDAVFKRPGHEYLQLKSLITSVLQPFGPQCSVQGPGQTLHVEVSNTLALFFHEIATNSLKHGALGAAQGQVNIGWHCAAESLIISWQESGGPRIDGPPSEHGFGTYMIDRLVSSAGGSIERSWLKLGLNVKLQLPLKS